MSEKVLEKVDETIELICKKIIEKEMLSEEYADTVKALASLIEARAQLPY